MKQQRILTLGFFGFSTGKKDGQTIKTRQCLELLERNVDKNVCINSFDTEILHAKPWKIISLLWKTIRADKVIYLPAQNNLYYFFPALYALSKLFHFDIVYLLIGGWLPLFLEKNPRWVKKLRGIKGILPENETITALLKEKFNLRNVYTMPNFRFTEYIPQQPTPRTGEFRLVFMSRIVKEKGLETVFQIAKYFSKPETREKCAVSCDCYGEIAHKDEVWFKQMLQNSSNVCFKGSLEPSEISRVLSAYDALILPTRYPGEGVPGAIIDAYMAGIPVLVSDWMYIPEIVENGQTGYLVSLNQDEVEKYIRHIEYLCSHPQVLLNMKAAARAQATKYDEKTAWAVLKPFLA